MGRRRPLPQPDPREFTLSRIRHFVQDPRKPDPDMEEEDGDDPDRGPSKTRRKQAMHDLQAIGERLVTLSSDRLKKIEMPERLLEAVLAAQRISAHGAHRRQLQFIGKLMRETDTDPILDAFAIIDGQSAAENARLHRLETLRTRLLEDEKTLEQIAREHPGVDLQQLRQLRRNAVKEQAAGRPPKAFRAIFQFLKDLENGQTPDATPADLDAPEETPDHEQ